MELRLGLPPNWAREPLPLLALQVLPLDMSRPPFDWAPSQPLLPWKPERRFTPPASKEIIIIIMETTRPSQAVTSSHSNSHGEASGGGFWDPFYRHVSLEIETLKDPGACWENLGLPAEPSAQVQS